MRKGFTRRPGKEHGDAAEEPARAAVKNYITPGGLQRLRDEHKFLLTRERPAVTQVVAWAVSIVGADEVDLHRHHISWMSPLARAMMKSGPGDSVVLHAPGRTERLQILDVRY